MDSFKNMLNNDKKDDKNKDNTHPNKVQDEMQPLTNKPQPNPKGLQSFTDDLVSFKDTLRGKVEVAAGEFVTKTDLVKTNMNDSFHKLDDKLKAVFNEQKLVINKWVRGKIQTTLLTFIESMRSKVKESAKDPDMCNCVKNLVDDLIDDIWPEIMEEVQFNLQMGLSSPFVEITHKKSIICFYPCQKLRNWYLYAVDPYDRTIWKKLKTISWWFWTIVSAFPFYGVSQYFYVLDFIMRDTQDEFQLVQFILGIKTMYFITQGVLKSMIGYFLLYSCVTMVSKSNGSQMISTCSRNGPGASIQVFAEVVGFFVQIVMIWTAFLLLPLSQAKGKPQFLYEDTRIEKGCFNRGGRIKYFMIYDFFALSGSVGLFFLVYLLQFDPSFNNSGDFIYFAEICYGLLSFPFLLFNLPIIKDRLTKAKATSYDRKGNCVPANQSIALNYGTEDKTTQKGFMDQMSIDVGEVFDG